VLVPAGTPKPIVAKLNAEINKMLKRLIRPGKLHKWKGTPEITGCPAVSETI